MAIVDEKGTALPTVPRPGCPSPDARRQPWTAAAASTRRAPADDADQIPRGASGCGIPVDAAGASGQEAPLEDPSFIRALCHQHRSWVTNRVDADLLPTGWRALLERTFAEISSVVGTQRYMLRRLEAGMGSLDITLVPIRRADLQPAAGHVQVLDLVESARERSMRLCQVCGEAGRQRSTHPGRILCGEHARTSDAPPAGIPPEAVVPAIDEESADATTHRAKSREAGNGRMQLYCHSDVVAALDGHGDEQDGSGATEHANNLLRILRRGEEASWRDLKVPTLDHVAALDDLDRRAPHFGQVIDLVRRNVRAAIAMDLPLTLPALMLVGEPGFGKTWFVSRLAAALGLPVRMLSMNTASVGDSITGAHPVWRNARPGLVARTLLAEPTVNPVFLVDEVDKCAGYNGEDPFRPFYTVLEPENARSLVDDYLGFPMDASRASWVLAGNSVQPLPAPIVDRLAVMTIPAMDAGQRRAVAASVYLEANAAKRDYFDADLRDEVAERLAAMTPRGMRRSLEDAMVRAAAAGRRTLLPEDVADDRGSIGRRIGFGPWS